MAMKVTPVRLAIRSHLYENKPPTYLLRWDARTRLSCHRIRVLPPARLDVKAPTVRVRVEERAPRRARGAWVRAQNICCYKQSLRESSSHAVFLRRRSGGGDQSPVDIHGRGFDLRPTCAAHLRVPRVGSEPLSGPRVKTTPSATSKTVRPKRSGLFSSSSVILPLTP